MLQAPVPSTAAHWRSLVLTVGAAGALVIAIDTSLDAQAMVRSRGANVAPTLVASSVASTTPGTTPSRDATTASTSPIERCADPSGAE
ncbi:MAG: hypothetical protein MUD17_02935 [Gemmatimonadaceae bacterium]|jgi:hypothetical protein|nr:hypothetical protein [Gemmatimonadaceae bacterium]